MGLVHSHNLLTQPVTLNRMRFVCQKDSKMPKQLQKFNIELLANDLNKLGFNIKLRDAKGKALSNDKICNEIYKSKPNVEGMCMINGSSVSSKGVTELAKYFNKYYGTNIPLTVNPMDPQSKKRSIPEICDDLYLVSDKISRSLADDVQGVKRKLLESIDQLKMQQRLLDESFAQHLNSLKKVGRPVIGDRYDAMGQKMANIVAAREAMRGELQQQIVYANKVASKLGSELDARFYPHVRYVQGVLQRYHDLPYDGTVRNVMMQTNNIISAVKATSVGAQGCMDCLKKLDMDLKDYDAGNPQAWKDALQRHYNLAMGQAASAEEKESLNRCFSILLSKPELCKQDAKADQDFGNLAKQQVKLKQDGGASNRAAFWVAADDSEESEEYF